MNGYTFYSGFSGIDYVYASDSFTQSIKTATIGLCIFVDHTPVVFEWICGQDNYLLRNQNITNKLQLEINSFLNAH